ncbi:MAG TPA: A24 family peptidase [Steroidobacteraceae bacterium]|jgi:leader peptidase (prepilin peptidase)/N-methyltransferase
MNDLLASLAYLFVTLPAAWIAVVFVFSLLVGSFLNVVIHRVPVMLEREWRKQATEILREKQEGDPQPEAPYNLVVPRSACPKCGAPITAMQNIPVVSYLLLGGKCASCGVKIAARYPLVELGTAILSALVAWRFGFGWYTGAALLLTWVLIALACIDFDTQLLPDSMALPLMWAGLLLSLVAPDASIGLPVNPRSSIIGAAVGYLSLWAVYHVFRLLTGKEGMGYGDFKLLAALGAWLGWQMLLPIILLSALAGSIVGGALIVFRGRDHQIPMPYGPFLAIAGWIALLWGHEIVGSYLHFAGVSSVQ